MRMWKKLIMATVGAGIVVAGAIGVTTAPAAADDASAQSRWMYTGDSGKSSVDAGGRWVYAKASRDRDNWIKVKFTPYGEKLHIVDHHDRDGYRSAVAQIDVQGIGVRSYTDLSEAFGDEYIRDLSIPEGRGVHVRVCTSSSPKAVCTPWQSGGRT